MLFSLSFKPLYFQLGQLFIFGRSLMISRSHYPPIYQLPEGVYLLNIPWEEKQHEIDGQTTIFLRGPITWQNFSPGWNSEKPHVIALKFGHAQWLCFQRNKMAVSHFSPQFQISARAETSHVIATKFQPGGGLKFQPGLKFAKRYVYFGSSF